MARESEGRKVCGQRLKIDARLIRANDNPRNPLFPWEAGESLFSGRPNDLWAMGCSPDPSRRAEFCTQMEERAKELVEWAATFLKAGQLEPVELRDNGSKKGQENTYTLVFGARRCLAILYNWASLGGKGVPWVEAQLSPKLNATGLLHRSLIENIRKDPNPVELARGIGMARNQGQEVSEIALTYGKSEAWVRKMLSLLELPEGVLKRIAAGTLSMEAALGEKRAKANGDGNGHASRPKVRPRKEIEKALDLLQDDSSKRVLRWVLGLEESL